MIRSIPFRLVPCCCYLCVPSREIVRFKRVAKIVRRERRAGNVWHRAMPPKTAAPIEAPPPQPVQLLPSPDQPRLPLQSPDSLPPSDSSQPPRSPQSLQPPEAAPKTTRGWNLWGWWRN